MKDRRISELDLLRFIAATMVLVYHYTYSDAWFAGAFRYGYLGVELFFLISGFVILWSADGRSAGQFVRSRFLRLYPMFWLGVVITLIVLALASRANFSRFDIAANLTMLPGYLGVDMIDGVYWTLAVEFKFYVLVLALILTKQMKRIEFWVYAWLAALLAGSAIDSGTLASLTLWPHGYFFVGGAICYFLRSHGFTWPRAAALLITAAASMYETTQTAGDFTWAPFIADPAYVCGILAACYFVILAVSLRTISLPGAAVLGALGALTYPLYLLHGQLGRVARATFLADLPSIAKLLIAAALAYALAWLCARYAEPAFRVLVASALDRAVALGRRGRAAAVPEGPQA